MSKKAPTYPQVYLESPDSFKIQDFLSALAAAGGHDFFMIDPETGLAINDVWLNTPVIGLSTYDRSKDVLIGFPVKGKTSGPSNPGKVYRLEAKIDLEVPSQNLPPGLKGETWVIQVLDHEKIDTFLPIAKALSERFRVKIIMTASQMRDPDPDHLFSEPTDPENPEGPKFCPIIIRKFRQINHA